jgi:thiol-disulfide isomerase/thioredoxin
MKIIQILLRRMSLPIVILSLFSISISAQDLNSGCRSLKSENWMVKAGVTFNVQLPAQVIKDAATAKVSSSVNAFFQTWNDTEAVEFDFVDFTGKQRKISEFRGKYVLLDFWATWCNPCLADIPKLKILYDKHKANGFEIVGMDSETIGEEEGETDPEFAKETTKRAKQIVETRGVTWTQATDLTAVPVAKKIFSVKTLPTKILLDKKGKIIATIGEKDDLSGIIEKLLATPK